MLRQQGSSLRRTLCAALLGHKPALVTEPCRCRRCGHMIRWNGNGGWRLTGIYEWYPRRSREVTESNSSPVSVNSPFGI